MNMNSNARSAEIDWKRVKHLLKLGRFAALMVFAADMILGWGTYYYDAEGLPPKMVSAPGKEYLNLRSSFASPRNW